jgi:hypothetical protein
MPEARVVGDRFVLGDRIGSGSMGVVFRATDRTTGRAVALKVLRDLGDVSMERFAREAKVLWDVRHPAIVGYVAHGQTAGGEAYLAMEWLDGTTVRERLSRGPLSIAETLALGTRVASALGAAHRAGIVHRDLKPENLLLEGGHIDRVKVLDFGVARLARGELEQLTMTGEMLGTPGYMAPEQARGLADVDARADVYSLGALLFHCLTGHMPFEGGSALSVLLKVGYFDEPPRPRTERRDVPEALDDLVVSMLASAPERRPANGDDVQRALEQLARSSSPHPAGPRAQPRRDSGATGLGRESTERMEPIRSPATAAKAAPRCMLIIPRPRVRLGATVVLPDLLSRQAALQAALATHGITPRVLGDATLVVELSGAGALEHAARCALGLGGVAGPVPLALVANAATAQSSSFSVAVLDHAARLAREGVPNTVQLDADAAALLERSFEIGHNPLGPVLLRERRAGARIDGAALRQPMDAPGKTAPVERSWPSYLGAAMGLVALSVLAFVVAWSVSRRVSSSRPTEATRLGVGATSEPSGPAASTSSVAPAAASSGAPRPCSMHRCEPLEVLRLADPAAIELVEVLPAVRALAQQVHAGAVLRGAFAEGVISGGTFDGRAPAGVRFDFEHPGETPGARPKALHITIAAGEVRVALDGDAAGVRPRWELPLPDPTCSARRAWEAVVASGVPHDAAARYGYHYPSVRPAWVFQDEQMERWLRHLDPMTCTVLRASGQLRGGPAPTTAMPTGSERQ